jgi:osmotically-inducible protein OsmY
MDVGRVETFWSKDQATKRTVSVEGVESVVSELNVPRAEDDGALARDVARAVQRYTYYTIWDQIEGRVTDGAVSLSGLVTPDRDKIGEIFERVAKVKGVQDVHSEILRLPLSQRYRKLRQALAYRVFRSEHFERFYSMTNPPFHIIVDSGVVTLVGQAQSMVEAHEIQRIVVQTQGVSRVENQLQIVRE